MLAFRAKAIHIAIDILEMYIRVSGNVRCLKIQSLIVYLKMYMISAIEWPP